ncbi:MAG: aminoglycoside phosphotransferase family protein [Chloroflexota bacterium]
MLDGKHLIGTGRTCEVFAWEHDRVLKLLLPEVPQEWADIEAGIGHDVQAAGLPAPFHGEILELDGRRGFIQEHLNAPSMLELLGKKPWQASRLARLLAKLQTQVHACPAPAAWLDQRDWLRKDIEQNDLIPQDLKANVMAILDRLPDGKQMCHGDFHPGNIVMTANGAVIIDWLTATRGHPLSDVARSVVLMSVGQPPPGTPSLWLIEMIRKNLLNTYLKTYFKLTLQGREQFLAWRAVNAAAFLLHSMPEERPLLLEMIEAGVAGTQ